MNKKLFLGLLIISAFISINSATAREWFEGGTLHKASIKQWNIATYSNKLATCAGFIITTINDGYFLHDGKINSDNPIKRLSEILVEDTDEYVTIANNQDEPVAKIIFQVMLELGWIKPNYLIFLAASAHTPPSSKTNETTLTPTTDKENFDRKTYSLTLPKLRMSASENIGACLRLMDTNGSRKTSYL